MKKIALASAFVFATAGLFAQTAPATTAKPVSTPTTIKKEQPKAAPMAKPAAKMQTTPAPAKPAKTMKPAAKTAPAPTATGAPKAKHRKHHKKAAATTGKAETAPTTKH